jgi:hypothetical protein
MSRQPGSVMAAVMAPAGASAIRLADGAGKSGAGIRTPALLRRDVDLAEKCQDCLEVAWAPSGSEVPAAMARASMPSAERMSCAPSGAGQCASAAAVSMTETVLTR